jgi:hypothetical protein
MKNTLIIIGIFIMLSWLISDEIIEILSDISGVVFYMFTLLCMVSISTILAIEIAKIIRYKILDKELKTLKSEMNLLQSKNIFFIEFTNEATALQNSLATLEQKIRLLKEKSHETI